MKHAGANFDAAWRARCVVAETSAAYLKACVQTHYLGKYPTITTCCLALWEGPFVVGMVMFATPPHETCKRYGGETWELARLWVADAVPRNGETWLIGQAIRHVRQAHPDVRYLVSYADPSVGHTGGIYRASNWTFDGMTDEGRKTPRCDYADATGHKYSRKAHVPEGLEVRRVPRVSKYRFVYELQKQHS